jgi:poly(hydroxyalkanoate) granule-associated protein
MNTAQNWNREDLQRMGRELFKGARELWLAGLGVVAEAEGQSREAVDRLIERGRAVEARRKAALETAAARAQAAVKEAGKLFEDTVEFESKAALKRLGLMTRDDVRILSARLDTLSRKLDEFAHPRA